MSSTPAPRRASGRGCGKLILLGEHAAVHGHPALAAGLSLGTTVHLSPRDGATSLGRAAVRDAPLRRALELALPPRGLLVDIDSDLPVGRGMGSSAALAIALLRARASLEGRSPSFAELYREGFAIERVFHGRPSGIDHAAAALGGAVVIRRGHPPRPVGMPPVQAVVLDSGSAGRTSELVARVAARRPGIDPLLERIGALVESALGILDDPVALGEAMNQAHELLRSIGVSTPRLDELAALARRHGATGAKLSGAGGGGVVLALTPGGAQPLLRAARSRDIPALACNLPGPTRD